jgi:hypothetical protein
VLVRYVSRGVVGCGVQEEPCSRLRAVLLDPAAKFGKEARIREGAANGRGMTRLVADLVTAHASANDFPTRISCVKRAGHFESR